MSKNYQAYLVRFQRSPQAVTWRATLENAHSPEVVQFATERELLLFLLHRLQDEEQNGLNNRTHAET